MPIAGEYRLAAITPNFGGVAGDVCGVAAVSRNRRRLVEDARGSDISNPVEPARGELDLVQAGGRLTIPFHVQSVGRFSGAAELVLIQLSSQIFNALADRSLADRQLLPAGGALFGRNWPRRAAGNPRRHVAIANAGQRRDQCAHART